MRKNLFITAALSLSVFLTANAQLGDNGFYRVQNNATGRYVGIIHDRSETEVVTTQADLNALRAYKNWDWVESDPATIIYIEKKGSGTSNGKTYFDCNLHGQGTNTYAIINYDIKILDMGGKYRCYVVYNGTQYLSELDAASTAVVNKLNINNSSTYNWNIIPLNSAGNNYFGVKPTVTAEGKYYATMYADFGFTPAASAQGMKVYYAEKVADGKVVIQEITGPVPASTPVIFLCPSDTQSGNRLDIAKNNATLPSSNVLSGVYFCIANGQSFHKDFVAYDPETMRVLGVCSDGRPGFVKKSASDFVSPYLMFRPSGAIPANTAYLKVPSGTPDELPLITAEEYAAGINSVTIDGNVTSNITTLSGTTVRKNATSTAGLRPGVYIWNKKKIVVK